MTMIDESEQISKSVRVGDDLEAAIQTIKGGPLGVSLEHLELDIDSQKYPDNTIENMLEDLRVLGLVAKKTRQKQDRLHITLTRPKHYKKVEQARQSLGCWGEDPSAPRYSVCVCNYNMSDTLERAMRSVIEQLDETLYEVLVVDDGSNDGSLEVLEMLDRAYTNFRYISLPRDAKRRLGETRNISIRAARGEYVLIHIDADDVWDPYLQDVVTLFHKMEEAIGHDFLLAGQQTGIAKRDFLLAYGPYENVYRCEDRNMMMKLAQKKLLFFMDYEAYRTRLSRPTKKRIFKALWDISSQMTYDMRQNEAKLPQIINALIAPIMGGQFSLVTRVLRAILILPIFIVTRFMPPVINCISWEELRSYHNNNRGTYAEVMTRIGGDPDISFLSKEAQAIFSYDVKTPGFKGSQ